MQTLRQIWARAENVMVNARRIVFIGYSFPSTDFRFTNLLRDVLKRRKSGGRTLQVEVVDHDAKRLVEFLKERFGFEAKSKYYDFGAFAKTQREK